MSFQVMPSSVKQLHRSYLTVFRLRARPRVTPHALPVAMVTERALAPVATASPVPADDGPVLGKSHLSPMRQLVRRKWAVPSRCSLSSTSSGTSSSL